MRGSLAGDAAATAVFLLFQACGMCVSRLALSHESAGTKVLLGSVCGSVMLQWLPAPFAFFLGFSLPAHLCAACLALSCGGACLWARWKRGGSGPVPEVSGAGALFRLFRRRKFLWIVLLLWLFFCALTWRSFLWEDGRIYSSQATYGDMSMHLSFITSLAKQGRFPPEYSLLPGTRLSYPFLSDSISSSLVLCGASLKLAYFLPMVFAGGQVFGGFYLFACRMLKSPKKGGAAFLLFFFNGGFGFLCFLNGQRTFSDLFHGFYQTPTNLTELGFRWVNVVVDMMLPQRATLFGWAVLFPTLYLLYRAAFEGERRCFLYAGVLGGLLPMIHTHSFLALALVCGVWMFCALLRGRRWEERGARLGKLLVLLGLPLMSLLYTLLRDSSQDFLLWAACGAAGLFLLALCLLLWDRVRREGAGPLLATWGVLFLAACALALPQLCFWTFRQSGSGGFIRGHFGWVIPQGEDGYLLFYLKNIGLTGLLALGGLLSAKARQFAKWSPALAIWLLAELVEFQPNDYDNNKLLYAAFAFLCCAAAEWAVDLLEKLKQKGLRRAAAAAGLAVCTVSAALTMGREWVSRYELFGTGALALCDWVEEELPADALILTDQRHNNEIASLTGRSVVCGSPSYLYYHGLPFAKNQQAARQMYENPQDSQELFRELGVDYVLVSDFELSSFQVDEAALAQLFPKVYDDGGRRLYGPKDAGNGG